MSSINIEVDEATARAIEQYTNASVEHYAAGGMDLKGWEHARSYAVDALKGLLRANPEAFDYVRRMKVVEDARNKEARRA